MVKREKASIHVLDQGHTGNLFDGSCCAFGVFDGMHRGHRFLLDSAMVSAVRHNAESIVLTFDLDPDELFRPTTLKKLLTNEERISMLATSGVDRVVILPFNREFAARTPKDFLQSTFGGDVPIQLHVGVDIRFGARASGNVEDLQKWGQRVGCRIDAHGLELAEGIPITATRIRGLLYEGRIKQANDLLGYRYHVTSAVQPGRGEGTDMGFKTANLRIEDQFKVLGDGVYGGYVDLEGQLYKAAISVGVSPVFEAETSANCEVHILDYEGDLYDKKIKVEFARYIRPMKKFASTEDLITEVKANIKEIRETL